MLKKLILNSGLILQSLTENSNWIFDNRVLLHTIPTEYVDMLADTLWEKIVGSGRIPVAIVTKGTGGYMLAFAVRQAARRSLGLNLPLLFCRDERKTRGLCKLVEGPLPGEIQPGAAVFVDDLLNSGATFRKTELALSTEGFPLKLDQVACLVDFWRGSRAMAAQGYAIHSVFTRNELGLTRKDPTQSLFKSLKWHMFTTNDQNNPRMRIKGAPTLHSDALSFGMDNHRRMMVSKSTGDILWSYTPPKAKYKGDCCYAISVNDDVVWSSYDGCLIRADRQSGDIKWRVKLDQQLHSSPLYDAENNRIFIGTERGDFSFFVGKGDIRSINAETGQTNWSTTTNGMIPGNCTYEAATDTVVCPSNDLNLYILEARTGAVRFKLPCKGEVKGEAVFSSSETGICYTFSLGGWVSRINVVSGCVEWTRRVGSSARLSSPFVHDGMVVACSEQKHAIGLSPSTGEIQWVRTLRGFVSQKPVKFGDDKLILITDNGWANVLSVATGEKLATSKIGAEVERFFGCSVHQPALVDGDYIYIATDNKGMYCYELDLKP